jgi:hypothetical protein
MLSGLNQLINGNEAWVKQVSYHALLGVQTTYLAYAVFVNAALSI